MYVASYILYYINVIDCLKLDNEKMHTASFTHIIILLNLTTVLPCTRYIAAGKNNFTMCAN